jgi:hypothetical protein
MEIFLTSLLFNTSVHEKSYGGWIFRVLPNQYPTKRYGADEGGLVIMKPEAHMGQNNLYCQS